MSRHHHTNTRTSTVRAVGLIAIAIGVALCAWQLRPATTTRSTAPDADIVLGATWLVWALVSYLALAVTATCLARLATGFGMAGESFARIAPARLRRLVDAALTVGVAAALVGGPAVGMAAAAAPRIIATHSISGSPLDWPGLAPTVSPTKTPTSHRANPKPHTVVVQTGDTLWTIAARSLGPHASGAAITAAWHAWYAANHDVIGPNPSVIHPGQRLVAPASNPVAQ